MTPDDYLGPEDAARVEIEAILVASGWVVQDYKKIALGIAPGVAVREYPMTAGHGTADYLLFVDGGPVGVIEAKRSGTPLVEDLEAGLAEFAALAESLAGSSVDDEGSAE